MLDTFKVLEMMDPTQLELLKNVCPLLRHHVRGEVREFSVS